MFGAASMFTERGLVRDLPQMRRFYEADLAAVQGVLDEESFEQAVDRGRSMSVNEAIAFALDEGVGAAEQ
jgi:hypothetical protein